MKGNERKQNHSNNEVFLEASIVHEGVLKAVHDDDIESLFHSLGVFDDFIKGRCRCFFCTDTISSNNFYAIFPQAGRIEFCCEAPNCVSKIMKK